MTFTPPASVAVAVFSYGTPIARSPIPSPLKSPRATPDRPPNSPQALCNPLARPGTLPRRSHGSGWPSRGFDGRWLARTSTVARERGSVDITKSAAASGVRNCRIRVRRRDMAFSSLEPGSIYGVPRAGNSKSAKNVKIPQKAARSLTFRRVREVARLPAWSIVASRRCRRSWNSGHTAAPLGGLPRPLPAPDGPSRIDDRRSCSRPSSRGAGVRAPRVFDRRDQAADGGNPGWPSSGSDTARLRSPYNTWAGTTRTPLFVPMASGSPFSRPRLLAIREHVAFRKSVLTCKTPGSAAILPRRNGRRTAPLSRSSRHVPRAGDALHLRRPFQEADS